MLVCLDVMLVTMEILGFYIFCKLLICPVFKDEPTASLSDTSEGSIAVLVFSVMCCIWI